MKRKELWAKPLAVGLAVALAASSLSPGGLLVPLEVQAGETFTGTAAVKLADGTELSGAPRVDDELKVAVTGNDDNVECTYQWYRKGDPSDTAIDDATGETYTLTNDDLNKEILVEVSFTGNAFDATKSDATAAVKGKLFDDTTLPDAADVFTLDADGKNLTVSVTLKDAGSALEPTALQYCTEGPQAAEEKWADMTDNKIALTEGKGYAQGTIGVRVKATEGDASTLATDTSSPIWYGETIKGALKGTVALSSTTPKIGDKLTATFTDSESLGIADADLTYQYYYEDAEGKKTVIEGATSKEYTVQRADKGKKITVGVKAESKYNGELFPAFATNAVEKAAKQTITLSSVTKDVDKSSETYTCTVNASVEPEGTLRYACVETASNETASEPASDSTDWKVGTGANVFTGLIPGKKATFFVSLTDAEDEWYATSDTESQEETLSLLEHEAFDFEVKLEDITEGTNSGGKKVTVVPPAGITGLQCQFGSEAFGTDFEKEIAPSDVSSDLTITVKYPDNPKYNPCSVSKTIKPGNPTAKAPAMTADQIAFEPNGAKTKYVPQITAPTEDVDGGALTGKTLQYSIDGATYQDDATGIAAIQATEYAAGQAFKLWVKVKTSASENESNATTVTINAPAASTKPTITVNPSTADTTTATITAEAGATITYAVYTDTPTAPATAYTSGDEITLNDGETIKAIAIEDGKIYSEEATATFAKSPASGGDSGNSGSSGSSSGSSSSGGSSSTTTPKTETKPDGTTVTTTEEKKADGTTVTTTEEKKTDGTTTKTTEEKKTDGSTTTTTEEKKTDGSTTTTVEEKKADGSSTTTTDEKKADGSTAKTVEEKKTDGSSTTTTDEKKADGTTKKTVEEKKADGTATVKSEEKKADGSTTTVMRRYRRNRKTSRS